MQFFSPAFLSAVLVGFSVVSLSIGFAFSDLALLFILPLITVVFKSGYDLSLQSWQAHRARVVKPKTKLAPFLTGNLSAAVVSLGFTILAAITLSWQILIGSQAEIALLVTASGISALVYLVTKRILAGFLFHPFDAVWAARLATIAVTPIVIAAFYHYTWTHAVFSGEFLTSSLAQAIWLQPYDLPERGGSIQMLLSVMQVQTAAKLWLVTELQDYPVAAILFSIDSALFALVATHTFVLVASYVDARTPRK